MPEWLTTLVVLIVCSLYTTIVAGNTSSLKLARGSNGPMFEEVKQIVLNAPKWTPGMQYGKNVRVTYTMPVAINKKKDYK